MLLFGSSMMNNFFFCLSSLYKVKLEIIQHSQVGNLPGTELFISQQTMTAEKWYCDKL